MVKSTSHLKSNYRKLLAKAKDIVILQTTKSITLWDMETKMPPQGISLKSQQLALLSRIEYGMITNPEIGILLKHIEQNANYEALDEVQRRNVYLIRKNFNEQIRLPEKLIVNTSKQQAITIDTWKKAKACNSFSLFKPELKKLFGLKKQAAEILMEIKNTSSPYDALVDSFEPKMTCELITKIFAQLKQRLIVIVEKCLSASKQPDVTLLKRYIPVELQREISRSLAQYIEYDVQSKQARGRIDETEHPFTTGYFDDVRITTHYYEKNFTTSLFSILHEGGHALYDQNLNRDWMYQPIGDGCSFGFHESQSRLVENIVGRSSDFWQYFYPKLRGLTGKTFSNVNIEQFVHAINRVRASRIRVEADELTYCLHIIIRFEIEQALFGGNVDIVDLPEIWNQKYREYLNLNIQDDTEGVMQDTHWASGLFGYFPSYALGNIYSGQILSKMNKDLANWRTLLKQGHFFGIKKWLINNIYCYGNLYDPPDLLKKITGEPINIRPYINYLQCKYSKLYEY